MQSSIGLNACGSVKITATCTGRDDMRIQDHIQKNNLKQFPQEQGL